MRGKRVYQAANIKAWGLLVCNFIGRPFSNEDAGKFQSELVKAAYVFAIHIPLNLESRIFKKSVFQNLCCCKFVYIFSLYVYIIANFANQVFL